LTATLVVDTGPLVALLAPREPRHRWAKEALEVRARVVSCEAVVSEAFFLLRTSDRGSRALRAMLSDGALELVSMAREVGSITKPMERYSSVPMSFADACLVRMSELMPRTVVATLDSDFLVYRRFGRQVVPVLRP
jgi:predicted nucleic acid-binding protein